MQQKVPELLQHLLLRLGQLEVGGVALDGVQGAACFGHRWLVAILSRSPPASINEILIVPDSECMTPHPMAEICVLLFAVATPVALMFSKIFYN